jgi:oxygen-independent coproporphyrinogen-3 oxidase
MAGLYIHIPFCVRKCDYCAFYSEVSGDWKKQHLFFQSLEKEIINLSADFLPDTVFIGGGTPTAPDFQTLERYFPMFGRFGPAEFSVEVNPGTVDAQKLALLKRSGVNRLSIGMQSFDVHCLKTLGRIHSAEQAEAAFCLARATGFKNISLDLMFGIPGQTMQMLDADLDRALSLGPEHIAIYNLMYEEGTPLAERDPVRLDEELEREMYDHIRTRLKEAGFEHYEISNFAKPGFECRHNLLYWTGGEYIGCGPAAHSHWNGARWANVADLDDYCANGPRKEFEETLDPDAKERETLVMGLRLLRGVEVSSNVWKNCATVFQTLEKEGLLVIDEYRVRLSDEALFVSDAVFAELV